MNDEITIEQLSLFFPFGLQFLQHTMGTDVPTTITTLTISRVNVCHAFKDVRPIVYPIADGLEPANLTTLANFIHHIEGESFDSMAEAESWVYVSLHYTEQLDRLPHNFIKKLASLHLDVFGWLDAGLGINKHSLTQ